MIDSRLLTERGPGTAERVREALGRLDARQLDIFEKLDQEHRLEYLLADSEARRMEIHRDYWREKFGNTAKGIAGLSTVPLAVLGMLSVSTGIWKANSTDVVAMGSMSMAIAGAAAVVHMAKEKAVEIAARHVEGKAAKLAPPAMSTVAPPVTEAPHPAQKLASLGIQKPAELSAGELAVQRVVGRIVSASVDARANGREISEVQLREWGREVETKLAELQSRDPLAARRSAQRVGAMLRSYGIEIDAPQVGHGVGAPASRRFAMDA